MKATKIKPVATLVAQFAAGVEVEAIAHEGKVFLPVMNLSAIVSGDDDTDAAPSTHEEKPEPTKKGKTEKKPTSDPTKDAYTEKELMDMPTKELIKILKDEFDIDPNEYDGKNTNKKLRDLILDAQENGSTDAGKGEDDTDKGDENETDDEGSVTDKVAALLEAYDAGEKNKKSVISAIKKLATDDYEEADVLDLIQEFDDDTEADIDEIAEKIARVLEGKKATKTKKATKKSKKGDDDEDDLVEVSDLKVGDRVSVWWNDDNQDWYDGEVKSIKRGKVTIAYDDDTEDVIDPEINTKIKLID